MAFASERSEWPCCICNEKFKWFKMMYSENPATHVVDNTEWQDGTTTYGDGKMGEEAPPPSSTSSDAGKGQPQDKGKGKDKVKDRHSQG